jgi:hypothetical protein
VEILIELTFYEDLKAFKKMNKELLSVYKIEN